MVKIGQANNNNNNLKPKTQQADKTVKSENKPSIFSLDQDSKMKINESFSKYDLNDDGVIDHYEQQEIAKNDSGALSKLLRIFQLSDHTLVNKNFEDQIEEYSKLPSASSSGETPDLNEQLLAKNMNPSYSFKAILRGLQEQGIDYTLNKDGSVSYKDGEYTVVARNASSETMFGYSSSYIHNDIYDQSGNLVQTVCSDGDRSNTTGTHIINYDPASGKAITYDRFDAQY